MIVGNKSDLAPPPTVSPKEGITFTTCSAKTGANIAKVFNGLTHNILKRIKSGEIKAENVHHKIISDSRRQKRHRL
jgi:hypothetical protein